MAAAAAWPKPSRKQGRPHASGKYCPEPLVARDPSLRAILVLLAAATLALLSRLQQAAGRGRRKCSCRTPTTCAIGSTRHRLHAPQPPPERRRSSRLANRARRSGLWPQVRSLRRRQAAAGDRLSAGRRQASRLGSAQRRSRRRGGARAGSKMGQGHPDQWLGYLSQCGLSLDDKLVVPAARTFTRCATCSLKPSGISTTAWKAPGR